MPSGHDTEATAIDGPPRARLEAGHFDPGSRPPRLGRYVLLRELGRGAIGVVYAAYHEGLDRKLAIKVLNKQRAGRADLEARLRREARALAKLSHPNVVQVYDVGEFEGRVFVAMEFVEGETLTEWMRREHDLDEIISMFADAGRGLAAAHEAGVIHRDFKPDNVLVAEDGRPRVLDFGLARALEIDPEGPSASMINERELAPVGTSLDQLLHTGELGKSVGERLRARAVDPDETLDLYDLRPEPVELDVNEDEIATQSNVMAAELRALPSHHDQRDKPDSRETLDPAREGAGRGRDRISNTDPRAATAGSARAVDDASDPDIQRAETVMSNIGVGGLGDEDVLTRTGALMGTPAYMSPEQYLGQGVGHPSDQFSFCVALHEAAYGRRPFLGKSPLELAIATQAGEIVEAPPGSAVPTWLREVIVRGLSPAPGDRFASMHDLIDALQRDREQPRRRRWLAAVVIAGVAGLAFAIGVLAPQTESPCPSVDDSAAKLWTQTEAADLRGAFERSPLPYAAATSAAVEVRIGSWTRSWAEQQVEACEATRVRREFSPEVLGLRQACLDRGLHAYQALLEQLAIGDPTIIERAIEATAALPDPRRCGDVDALLSGVEGPADTVASEVVSIQGELAKIDTLTNVGRRQQGLVLAEALLERARATEYAPVIAEAMFARARLLASSGARDEALQALQDALDQAERSEHDALVPRVAIELVSLSISNGLETGLETGLDPAGARVWARRATAGLDHVEERGLTRALSIWRRGQLEHAAGDDGQAEALLREAIALLDEQVPSDPHRALMLDDLGQVLASSGDTDGARKTFNAALSEATELFGPGHPHLAHTHQGLARVELALGRRTEARAQIDQARRIYAEVYGPRHREVGSVELLRADIEILAGRLDEAATHAARAKDIYETELAPDQVERAEPHLQLGHIAVARGLLDQAIEHYRTALELQQLALPPGHPSMVSTHTALGLAYLSRGEPELALVEFERSVEILEASVRLDPDQLRLRQLYLGQALLARARPGDPARAARRFELALDGCEAPAQLCADLALGAARASAAAADPKAEISAPADVPAPR